MYGILSLIKFKICRRHHFSVHNLFEREVITFIPKHYLDLKCELMYDSTQSEAIFAFR